MDNNQVPKRSGLKKFFKSVKQEINLIFGQLRGGTKLEWAITAGMGVVVLFAILFEAREANSGLGLWVDLLVGTLGGLIAFGFSLLFGVIVLRLARVVLEKAPPLVLISMAIAAAAQVWLWGDNYQINLSLAAIVVLTGLCLSLSLYFLNEHRRLGASLRTWLVSSTLFAIGLAGVAAIFWLFLSPGQPAVTLPGQYLPSGAPDLPDPTEPGPFPVDYLTYGSGEDQRRPEYGDQVDLITQTVNASSFITFSGWQKKIREWYWGFGMSSVPVNAQVWYPQGEGPFPLVLVVHGNHAMTDFSEPGYAYLAELLASRGFIVASVDQNFFNGSLYGKAQSETDARAWLLLKHLETWERWNRQPGNIFYQNVDLDRIALIGHSRGGEAVGLAAAFNRLTHYPENGRITWNFNFSIKSVIAIAPVDQQYKPAGHPAEITDVNYLVLQGSHDGDVSSFKGIQQYERVSFTGPQGKLFKAAVYIYRANHGQFNSLWGDQDRSGVLGGLLNKAALLDDEAQRQIAEVYISAFLEATLNDRSEYLPLFQDYHTAGDWLPATNYITQYQDSGVQLIADFEEDADLTTASFPEGKTLAVGLSIWKERALRFRNNNLKDNHVVRLSWGGTNGYYAITMPVGSLQSLELAREDTLIFLVADEQEPVNLSETVDFSVILIDKDGRTASVQLSDVIEISPQLPTRFTKIDTWNDEIFENSSEVVMQSVRIPLDLFLKANPDLSLDHLIEIRFAFNKTRNRIISLDEIGFDLSD